MDTELPAKGENVNAHKLIGKYAEIAHSIYEERTAGDYTWEGFLITFLREVGGEKNV